MSQNIVIKNANNVVTDNYKTYSKYVLETRALPSVEDGLKLVQRRIIYAASQLPLKLIKTAALSGEVMKLHPHGDSTGSIYTMTYPGNHIKIFNIKGNHGGPSWSASAGRYTECYLNEIGRFNYCQFINYADYEEGELGIPEPTALPCLVPYGIIEGSSGMGVGLSTDIMPLNLMDLIDCYKAYIVHGEYRPDLVKPDPGPFIIENTRDEITEAVDIPKGRITCSAVITVESPTKVSVGMIPGKSIESVISRLGWWITDGYVDFTNESTDKVRYTFEIVNNKKGEITLEDLIFYLNKYCSSTNTYIRCMVDSDKSAIYCSLKYVMDKSLAVLNKAIDKWLESEKVKVNQKLELYNAIELAKKKGIFKNVSDKTSQQLIEAMVGIGINESLAKEVIKKPISYITKDHNTEMDELLAKLKELKNHNRKEYLYGLYDQLASMVKDDYNSKLHAVTRGDMLTSPKIRLNSFDSVEIYQDKRSGYKLGTKVYLVGKSGWVYIRSFSSPVKSIINLDIGEEIVGISTDAYRYIEVQTVKDKKGISCDADELQGRERYLIRLKDDEKIVNVIGWNNSAPDRVLKNITSKKSNSVWY